MHHVEPEMGEDLPRKFSEQIWPNASSTLSTIRLAPGRRVSIHPGLPFCVYHDKRYCDSRNTSLRPMAGFTLARDMRAHRRYGPEIFRRLIRFL